MDKHELHQKLIEHREREFNKCITLEERVSFMQKLLCLPRKDPDFIYDEAQIISGEKSEEDLK